MTRLALASMLAGLGLCSCLPNAPKPQSVDLAPVVVEMPDMAQGVCGEGCIEANVSPREFFETKVLPSLLGTCGGCHKIDGGVGPAFLKTTTPLRYDPYNTIRNWTGFIVDPPNLSALLKKGQHEGPPLLGADLDCTDQCGLVLEWIRREVAFDRANKPPTRQPQINPFTPKLDGTYTVIDVGARRDVSNSLIKPTAFGEIAGSRTIFNEAVIRFKATLIGNGKGLDIEDLRFFNLRAADVGTKLCRTIRFVRPLFVVWRPNGDKFTPIPDPVDNFVSTEKVVRLFGDDSDPDAKERVMPPMDLSQNYRPAAPNDGVLIVPGRLTLSDFRLGDSLSIVFNTFELVNVCLEKNPCKPEGLDQLVKLAPYLAKPMSPFNCGTRGNCHTKEYMAGGLLLGEGALLLDDGVENTTGSTYTPKTAPEFIALCEKIKFYNQAETMLLKVSPADLTDHARVRFKYSPDAGGVQGNCTRLGFPSNCFADFEKIINDWKAIDP